MVSGFSFFKLMKNYIMINENEMGDIGYQCAPLRQILGLTTLTELEQLVLLSLFSHTKSWKVSINGIATRQFGVVKKRSRISAAMKSLTDKGYISQSGDYLTVHLLRIDADYRKIKSVTISDNDTISTRDDSSQPGTISTRDEVSPGTISTSSTGTICPTNKSQVIKEESKNAEVDLKNRLNNIYYSDPVLDSQEEIYESESTIDVKSLPSGNSKNILQKIVDNLCEIQDMKTWEQSLDDLREFGTLEDAGKILGWDDSVLYNYSQRIDNVLAIIEQSN